MRNTRAMEASFIRETRDIVDRFFVNNLVDAMSTWCTAGILFNLLSPKVLVISRARFPAPFTSFATGRATLSLRVSFDASSDGAT